MGHLWNLQNEVQDTARGGTYHNKKFKQIAEEHGLIIEQHPKYGWTLTTLNDEAKAFNTLIKQFPQNIIAGMFNFKELEYFSASEGASKPVEVIF